MPSPSVTSLLANLVFVHGSRVALVEGNQSISYRELSEAISARAFHLQGLRAQFGAHFFPLIVDRSLDSALSVLAAIVERVPIALIDSELPAERQSQHIERLRTGKPGSNQAGEFQALSNSSQGMLAENDPSTCVGYVVFTSGSTGRPKGVILSYDTLEWRLELLQQRKAPNEQPRTIAHFKPFHFSEGLTLLAEVFNGDMVHLVDPRKDTVGNLWRYLADAGISYLSLAPSLARVLGRHSNLEKLEKVSHFVIGGEGAHFDSLSPFRGVLAPNTIIVNLFGFGEGFRPLHYEIPLEEAPKSGQIPVGALTNPEHVRLDPQVNSNSDSEIWVSGPIAEGYLNDPRLTHEKFVHYENKRWWKSADLIREVRPGIYHHAGRKDDLVKISGTLTSPSETANYILEFPGIEAAVVLAQPSSGNRLVAHVEPKSGGDFNPAELLRAIKKSLPSNQVPSEIICWKSLPTMGGGKVDRVALIALMERSER